MRNRALNIAATSMVLGLSCSGLLAAKAKTIFVTTAPATAPSTAPASAFDAVRSAPNPSAAVEAYARAAATHAGDIELQKAYVHRMVELNVPEMAEIQAQDLVRRNGADGVASAVVGYMAAARGAPAAAIENLRTAAEQSPDDPFVLRTVAQVIAWYDTTNDRSMLDKDATQTLEWLRKQSGAQAAYADAYRAAVEMRRNWPANPATQPAAAASADTAELPPGPEASYPTYTDPYAYDSRFDYPAAYGGGTWYYWPSVIVLHDRDFDHHHRPGGSLSTFSPGGRRDGDGGDSRFGTNRDPRMVRPGGTFNRTDHTFGPPNHTFSRPNTFQPGGTFAPHGGGGTSGTGGNWRGGSTATPRSSPSPSVTDRGSAATGGAGGGTRTYNGRR
jgi:hypothetical protein